MAGRPMKRKVLAELEQRGGKQYFQEYICRAVRYQNWLKIWILAGVICTRY